MHLAVEKGNKCLNILLLRVFFADYCQSYIQHCICVTIRVCVTAIVNTAPYLYQEGDFSLKKRMKDFFCLYSDIYAYFR